MADEFIIKTVTAAMVEEFELDPKLMTNEARIKEDLRLDSLDIVDLVIVLETAFNFKIRDKSALREIKTLGDIFSFIQRIVDEEKEQKSDLVA